MFASNFIWYTFKCIDNILPNVLHKILEYKTAVLEDVFSLTCICLYKGRKLDFLLLQENIAQRKPVFWHILRSVTASFEPIEYINLVLCRGVFRTVKHLCCCV